MDAAGEDEEGDVGEDYDVVSNENTAQDSEDGETGESGIKHCHGLAEGMDGYLPSTLIIKLFT